MFEVATLHFLYLQTGGRGNIHDIIQHRFPTTMSMKRFEPSGLVVRCTPHSEESYDKMREFQDSELKIYCMFSLGNYVCMETFNRMIKNAVYIIEINYSYLFCLSLTAYGKGKYSPTESCELLEHILAGFPSYSHF